MSRKILRPCLKHSSNVDPPAPTNSPLPFAFSSVLGPRVHFPPSPGLCQTHLTHSPSMYDRAPIVVTPNACALPERNERTYPAVSEPPPCPRKCRATRAAAQGATLHPQALAATNSYNKTSDPIGRMPSRVPDLSFSSESDESDISSTPPEPTSFPSHHPPISIVVDGTVGPAAALAFLPHANERVKPRRERSRSKTRGACSARKSEFALPDLDGCLGGF